jgi:type IV pilus assembly protein PilY1
MNVNVNTRILSACAAFLLALGGGKAAFADDSEIFIGTSNSGVAPNILFILDTSGSMRTEVREQRPPYDPATTYTGTCLSDRLYTLSSNTTALPNGCDADGMGFVDLALMDCDSATSPLATVGRYTGRFVQWRSTTNNGRTTWSWSTTIRASTNRYEIACLADYQANISPYPTSGSYNTNSGTNQWTTNRTNSYWGGGGNGGGYQLFTGNYLNYRGSTGARIGTRLSVMKEAATNLLNTMTNVNVGIMRYSNNGGSDEERAASGGMMAYPVSPIATNRANLVSTVNGFTADGWTPLSETLFEAYRYYTGGNVYFGDFPTVSPYRSVAASRVGNTLASRQYKTPVDYQCQKNFIVYLTDGLPTKDNEADAPIRALPDFSTLGGACDNTSVSPYNGLNADGTPIPEGWDRVNGDASGECMTALAKYMYGMDMSTTMPDQQNVTTYTIGFGDDPSLVAASSWLQRAATAGGGKFHSAGNLDQLEQALTEIVNNIQKTSTTFTAPTVAVNAFNRTRTLNDLYVTLFTPGVNRHWVGNLKKYTVRNGVIVDAQGAPAVDPSTGFFRTTAQSIWSDQPDGPYVEQGGAANEIPQWDPALANPRKVYTYIGNNQPGGLVDLSSSAAHAVNTANTAITTTVLGVATEDDRTSVINYARGEDPRDENGNNSDVDSRRAMGDPVHAQPGVVIYGGTTTTQNVNDAVIYSTTNDGYLHAFDVTNGMELWSYIPQEFLPELQSLYRNNPTNPKEYALDGNVKVFKYDANGDGIVDRSIDRVILYFGTARGGSRYYAIDVTDRNRPSFMWSIGPETAGLSGIGQTWSTPEITRVRIQGATQNSLQYVLVIGGGYDPVEEGTNYSETNSVGNAVYMIDALRGTVLWSASNSATASLTLPRMTHSIPSEVTVLDLDGNSFADRMYVGDMAGQIWRFDIFNGQNVSGVVTGGVLASLGSKDESTHTVANARRFYTAPDVASIKRRGIEPFLSIAIGSGYRGHPLNTTIQDRFYSIRDYNITRKLSQAQYNDSSRKIIRDSQGPAGSTDPFLVDVTGNPNTILPNGSPGWKLTLNQPGNSYVGEKVLVPATTFDNVILFNTYTPSAASANNPCSPGLGQNRVCAVSAYDGSPVGGSERCQLLAQGGIAPPVSFLFPTGDSGNGIPPPGGGTGGPGSGGGGSDGGGGTGTPTGPAEHGVVCMAGVEVLSICRDFDTRIKTYWSESNAK